MINLPSEVFHIDTPDELGEFSQSLFKELVDLMPGRQGKLVQFTSVAQGKRVINDLVLLATQGKLDVFETKVKKSPHRKIYVRPSSENK